MDAPPPIRPPSPRVWRFFVVPVLVGAVYGLVVRIVLGSGLLAAVFQTQAANVERELFTVVSVGFIFGVPAVMGFFVARLIPRPRALLAIGLSVLAVTGLLVGAGVTFLEGSICIVMMAPAAYLTAGLTAALTIVWRRVIGREPTGPGPYLAAGVLPLLVAAAEHAVGPAEDVRVVETRIVIRAPVETIWANVVRVPAIRDDERETTFFHRIGFPRPVEATIDGTGVGAVRHATFERGVLFVETVTTWRDRAELAFSIDARDVPPTAFDQHVVPGGRHFATLEGRYRLEPAGDGAVVLHLSSRSRLTTTLNWYAAPWIDGAMRSIQEDILRIVKARCERGEIPR